MRDEQPASIVGVYTQPYNEIVRPGQVWKISKYFLRRWTPYLSPSEVWLVIGARQLSYFNEKRPWFKAYDQHLASASGVHVRTFRRTLKKELVEPEGPLSTFVSKVGDPAYITGQPVPKQEKTRYNVRLDDPLTPGDAAALAYWLRRHAPERVTPQAVMDLLTAARQESPHALWADAVEPEVEDLGQLTVADVAAQVFPSVTSSSVWREAADRLHTHIVEAHLFHLETQYLRKRWLPDLGPGPTLLLVYLRSLCYHNPQTGETRDELALLSGQLEALFQKSSVTLRSWFSRLEDKLGNGHPHGPFVQAIKAQKLPSQKVETRYRLNLLTPLHPDDLSRYRNLIDRYKEPGSAGVAQEMAVTPKEGEERSVSHARRGRERFVSHEREGDARNGSHEEAGEQSSVRGLGKKWQPFNYYKILLGTLGLDSFKDLETARQQQQQDPWHLHDGRARLSFADVAANGSLEELLNYLNIQEPARGTVLKRRPSVEEVVAWYLYVQQEDGLESPISYLIKRVTAGDPPPIHYLQLASLSWEQWRTYAAVCYLHPGSVPDSIAEMPLFAEWRELYADVPLTALPFDVGSGLNELPVGLDPPAGEPDLSSLGERARSSTPAGDTLWQATLQDLSHQMARATFDAWLRDSCLVEQTNGLFVVGVRSRSAKEWIENRLQDLVCDTLAAVAEQEDVSVRFVVQGERETW